MRLKHLPLILLILAFSSRGRAETAEEMLSACRQVAKANVSDSKVELTQDFETGHCWGAFTVIQEITRHAHGTKQPTYGVCAQGTSRTQLIAIFVKYAEDNPKKLHKEFLNVALTSLREALPCRRGSR